LYQNLRDSQMGKAMQYINGVEFLTAELSAGSGGGSLVGPYSGFGYGGGDGNGGYVRDANTLANRTNRFGAAPATMGSNLYMKGKLLAAGEERYRGLHSDSERNVLNRNEGLKKGTSTSSVTWTKDATTSAKDGTITGSIDPARFKKQYQFPTYKVIEQFKTVRPVYFRFTIAGREIFKYDMTSKGITTTVSPFPAGHVLFGDGA